MQRKTYLNLVVFTGGEYMTDSFSVAFTFKYCPSKNTLSEVSTILVDTLDLVLDAFLLEVLATLLTVGTEKFSGSPVMTVGPSGAVYSENILSLSSSCWTSSSSGSGLLLPSTERNI